MAILYILIILILSFLCIYYTITFKSQQEIEEEKRRNFKKLRGWSID